MLTRLGLLSLSPDLILDSFGPRFLKRGPKKRSLSLPRFVVVTVHELNHVQVGSVRRLRSFFQPFLVRSSEMDESAEHKPAPPEQLIRRGVAKEEARPVR